jgi:hypothetical protein
VELHLRHRVKVGDSRPLVQEPMVLGTWTLGVGEPQPLDLKLPAAGGIGR